MTVETYAMNILKENKCDIYTYGGKFCGELMDDLKRAYPDGMEFPYIDVANAILAVSRPEPIRRDAYMVCWDNDSCCDGFGVDTLEDAKRLAFEVLGGWMAETEKEYPGNTDEWNYMINNCSVHVDIYNPNTDEYDDNYWYPSDDELETIGWVEREEQ